jgi:hypothetical protein
MSTALLEHRILKASRVDRQHMSETECTIAVHRY